MTIRTYVLDQSAPAPTPLPGVAHATWAGGQEGLKNLSLWRQSLAPGQATPPHTHQGRWYDANAAAVSSTVKGCQGP